MSYPTPMDVAESEDREAMTDPFADELAKCSVLYTENLVAEREALIAELATAKAQLAELQSAAWDVCDVVQDALDTPEDADMKKIRKLLDEMGELIPAARPSVRDDAAPIQWFCGPCNCWHSPPMHTDRETVTP